MSDQAKPGAAIELSDHDRLVAVLFSSFLGWCAFQVCYRFCGLRDCLVQTKSVEAWIWAEIAFIFLVPMGLHGRRYWWRLKKSFSDEPGQQPEEIERFAYRLKGINVVAAGGVLWLILATGGIYHSPFASYGVTLVVLGIFLQDAGTPHQRVKKGAWLALAGVVFYAVLLSRSHGQSSDVYFRDLDKHPDALQTAAFATSIFSLIMGGFTSSRGKMTSPKKGVGSATG